MALVIAFLSVLVIVEGSTTTQWKNEHVNHHSVNTGYNDTSTCSNTWFFTRQFDNGSTACECGSDLGELISCDEASGQVELLENYCMTYDNDNRSLVVGKCYFASSHTFRNGRSYISAERYFLPSDPSLLNQRCNDYGRTGQLCGKCKDGYTLPVYSYSLSCVECTDYSYNWVKYLAAAFLPLTLFFFVVIIFRVSVTVGLLDVFILFSQFMSFPALMHPLSFRHWKQHYVTLAVFSLASMYGIWNLDFFRLLYPPFCMHPKMSTLHVLFLDYAIAVYPLLLIIASYVLVELHDHNFRLIVWLWKPFHRCFVCFRREWNIKNSLIDAFCTFLLLSYIKFLSVSFNLLVPVSIFNIHGETIRKYLLFDGSVEYFGPEHLPFAILALAVLLVFNILPLVVLCLYPCQCFQRCLNYCRIRYQTLHIFMDSFQGCYKNRASNTCDCRWFAVLYLMIRIALIAVYGILPSSNFVIIWVIFLVLLLLFLLAVFHPYKSPIHNTINILLLFIVTIFAVSSTADFIAYNTATLLAHSKIRKLTDVITGIFSVIPLLFFIALLLYKCFGHRRCTKRVWQKICALMPCGVCSAVTHSGSEESLADRIVNAEQYVALLSEPITGSEESDGDMHSTESDVINF